MPCTRFIRPRPALLVLALGLAGPAWAQERPVPGGRTSPALQELINSDQRTQRPTFIEADTIQGTPDIELRLQGQATLRRADTFVRADRIDYDIARDRLKAEGSVRLNRAGNVFEGTELDLSVDAFSGFFTRPSYRFIRSGGYGQARQIEFIDEQRAIAQDANYTTCTVRPGPGWMPEWLVRASRLDLDNERNEARARGASLRFKDITVPVPDITFPLNENRKSGLLPPLIGVDTSNGLTYIQPYYINLAPNRDATLTTNVYARRGISLGGEFRYLESTLPDTRGEVRLNYMPQDELRGGRRWSYSQQHTGYTTWGQQDLRLNLNLNRVSDDNYWKDFPFAFGALNQRLLPTDVQLSTTRGEWTTSLRSLRWQTIQDINSPLTPPYNRSPQINVQFARASENWDWGFSNDLTAFSADRMQACLGTPAQNVGALITNCQPNANRLTSQFRAARPFHYNGLTLTPKLLVTARQYEYEGSGMGVDGTQYAQGLTVPTFSLDAGARLEKNTTFQGRDWIQTLEPRAFFVHTPYRDQSVFPVYDSARYDFNFATVFTENTYSGYDRIADNRLLTLGAITRFLNPADGSEGARFGIAQRLRIKEQRVLLPGESNLNDRLSDMLLGATLNLNRQWLFDSTVQYNPKTSTSERSAVGVRFNPTPYRLINVSYRNQTQFQSELVDIAWQWPLNDLWGDRGKDMGSGQGQGEGRWYSVARMNYSLQDKRLVDTLVGLEYDAGCWLGRMVIQQQQLGVLVNNRRIMFQLEFSGFGRVGANPLQQLQTQIPRYQMLRDNRLAAPSRFGLYD